MATAFENVFTALALLEATITGVSVAHTLTPEKLNDFPCFINMPSRGSTTFGPAGEYESHDTIIAELHVARGLLPEAESAARPFKNRFEILLLADVTISGTVSTITGLRSSYGSLTFGDETHLGWRFEIDIKMRYP